uniref:DNA mismatch repair protein MLH3 isoform X1 n=1 Tax=Tanacetum cinerariifolium TaxID=118510 RepID=A0A6L2J7D6_TANCI|nr:DNA mismatch repair protein MLH3 isoform X1 [Tanacetum cinerariifolium]
MPHGFGLLLDLLMWTFNHAMGFAEEDYIGFDSLVSIVKLRRSTKFRQQKHINKLSARDHLGLEVAFVSDLQSKARPDQKKVIDKAKITDSATEAVHCLDVWHTNSVGTFLYDTFCDFFTSVMVRVAKSIDALIKIGWFVFKKVRILTWTTTCCHLTSKEEEMIKDYVCLADEDSNFDDSIYTTKFLNGLRMSGCAMEQGSRIVIPKVLTIHHQYLAIGSLCEFHLEVLSLSSFSYFPTMSKSDMKNHVSTLFEDELGDLVKTFCIPLDLHPRLPDHRLTMDRISHDAIGISKYIFRNWGLVSFAKRQNIEDVCMDDGPSILKKWKDKFFLIDRKAIPNYHTWRHTHSCVFDDLPTDGYNPYDVERLRARLVCLCEINEEGTSVPLPTPEEIVVGQPDPRLAKKSEDHPKRKTTSTLATPCKPRQPFQKRRLKMKASEAGSSASLMEQAEGLDDTDMSNFCAELKDSLEGDESTPVRVVFAFMSHLVKRLVPLPLVEN